MLKKKKKKQVRVMRHESVEEKLRVEHGGMTSDLIWSDAIKKGPKPIKKKEMFENKIPELQRFYRNFDRCILN